MGNGPERQSFSAQGRGEAPTTTPNARGNLYADGYRHGGLGIIHGEPQHESDAERDLVSGSQNTVTRIIVAAVCDRRFFGAHRAPWHERLSRYFANLSKSYRRQESTSRSEATAIAPSGTCPGSGGRGSAHAEPKFNTTIRAGADTRFSVCVSRNPDLDNLKVQVPSGSQTATGGSLRQPRGGRNQADR